MDPNLISRAQCSGERIHQQELSQTLTSCGAINGKPAQVGDRNGVARQALAQCPGHILKRNGTSRQRIVAMDHSSARRIQGHEVLADPRRLILAREAPQILIELRDAAVKGLAIMPLAQFLD